MARKLFGFFLLTLVSLFAEHPHKVFHDAWSDVPSIFRSWISSNQSYWSPEPEFPRKEATGTPILLVHGYLHDNSAWLSLRDKLESKEVGPIYSPSLVNSTGDITKSALEVAQIAEFIMQETGEDKIILIGHSMGGIVSAYAAEYYLPEEKVAAVFTVGTPLKGTVVARLGFTEAARQMELSSPLLKKLTYKMRTNPKTNYYCFGSMCDEVVIPSKNAFFRDLKDKHPQDFLYHNVGHQGFLFSQEVIDDIAATIVKIN